MRPPVTKEEKPRAMEDIMREKMPVEEKIVTEKIVPAGIATAHMQSKEDMAKWFTNIFKCRQHIRELKWVVGSHLEVTFEKPGV